MNCLKETNPLIGAKYMSTSMPLIESIIALVAGTIDLANVIYTQVRNHFRRNENKHKKGHPKKVHFDTHELDTTNHPDKKEGKPADNSAKIV